MKREQEEVRRRRLGFNEENPWSQEKEDELVSRNELLLSADYFISFGTRQSIYINFEETERERRDEE